VTDALYLACPYCGRDAPEGRVCARCRLENVPTPLSEHIESQNQTLRDLAEETGLSEKTLKRCLHGEPMKERSAKRISAVTGIPWETLRAGQEVDDGRDEREQ
jgi:lambda repressor-like predicted transcriptional regulator